MTNEMKRDRDCPVGRENAAKIDANDKRLNRFEALADRVYDKIEDLQKAALNQVAESHARTVTAYEKALTRWPKSVFAALGVALTIIGMLIGWKVL